MYISSGLFIVVLLGLFSVVVTMAWRSSSNSNSGLIEQLKRNDIIKSTVVEQAMLLTDRANYVYNHPYLDAPQLIGYDATISAPHMHAYCLTVLQDVITIPNAKILDIGVGSGYLAVCMTKMNPSAKVYGIDIVPGLVQYALKNVMKQDADLLNSGRLVIREGDGWLGIEGEDKFNAIHVGAAAESLPRPLLKQLALGGKLVIPVGQQGEIQTLIEVRKLSDDDDDFNKAYQVKSLLSVQYVPLVKDN